MSTATYIFQRPSGYYFRFRIPADIKQLVSKTELRYSLRTGSLSIAKSRARAIAGKVQSIVRSIRRRQYMSEQKLTRKQFHYLISTYIRDVLTPPQVLKTEPTNDKGKRISEVIRLFLAEGDSSNRWTPKTRKELLASLQLLISVLGDIPVKSITRAAMSNFKQTVMQLPPNMNKDKCYRDKSIKEILAMKPEKTITAHTINKYLGRASTLFEYATVHGYMPLNPAKDMKVKLNTRNVDAREIFTPDDLKLIFNSKQYAQDTFRKSYQFWCPVLALFTGARVNEIAQLHLEDFQQHDSVWCININNDGDKTLKNEASKRLMPLHPFLVKELNILKLVEQLRKNGEMRFMPDLLKATDGYGVYVSKWFNERYKGGCGIGDGKVFHSFRHTFGTVLSHNGIDDHSLKALMGHAEKGTTFDTYVKRGTAEKLYQELVKYLDYNINLDHLKKSKWVVQV